MSSQSMFPRDPRRKTIAARLKIRKRRLVRCWYCPRRFVMHDGLVAHMLGDHWTRRPRVDDRIPS